MGTAAAPRRRPARSVLARALVAGTLLGALAGSALVIGDPTNVGDGSVLPGFALTAVLVGASIGVLSALAWLLVAGHGPRWLGEMAAGVVAALPFVALWVVLLATILLFAALLVGVVAALVARWQGYERDRSRRRLRPRSSPRAG